MVLLVIPLSEKKLTFYRSLSATTVWIQELIDAAWSALKTYIPNSVSSQSRALLLYAKSWQWRHIDLNANLQQKTIEALKRIFREKNACLQHPQKCSDENELLLR